ncbi:MAG: hypothetical protein E7661_08270 [Ruminococcaceae bacterium]|nr:hypothetical protein [Oscillospiraceae bacterium]
MNEGTRIFVGIICLLAAIGVGYLGARSLWVYIIFEKYPKKTKKVGAILQDAVQKNNVRVGIRRPVFVKHMTKAVYAYTVEGKLYYIKTTHYLTTKRQTPKFVPVVYITTHPRYAYIDDLTSSGEMEYLLFGIFFAAVSLMLFVGCLAGFGILPT